MCSQVWNSKLCCWNYNGAGSLEFKVCWPTAGYVIGQHILKSNDPAPLHSLWVCLPFKIHSVISQSLGINVKNVLFLECLEKWRGAD